MSPKISVCIPIYNSELWLAEAIQSVIDQSFDDWEIVVCDDGSTDATKELLAHYAEQLGEKMTGILNDKNEGIGFSRNAANALAKGEIICVQDSDDLSQKDRLKNTWKYFKRHKDADLVYGACQYIDAVGKPFHLVQAEPFDWERLKTHNYIQHPTVAYRKEAIIETGYRPECKVLDDWFLYLDFIKSGKMIGHMKDTLAFYRMLPTSVSHTQEKEKLVAEMREKFLTEAGK